MPTLLKKLGIPSPRHAAEIERDLGIRFSDFTPEHCDTWTEQTLYLYQFAQTRTTTHAARTAGITLAAARQWQSDNTLGFNQRLDDAVLEYTDDMEVLFLERTRQPDSPTSFMTTLLRAQMPEKYGPARRSTPSRDNHCDHDRGDDQDSEHTPAPSNNNQPSLANIQRQLEQLQHLTDKAHQVSDSQPDTPTDRPSVGAGFKPALVPSPTTEETTHPNLSPHGRDTTHPNLSPHGGETQRGGAPTPNDASDLSPTDQAPVGAGFKPALVPSPTTEETTHPNLSPNEGEDTAHPNLSPHGGETQRGGAPTPNDASNLSPTDQEPVEAGFKPALVPSPTTEETQREGTPQLPAPTTQHPSGLTRRQRRELQRKHKRKRQKSHRPRAPN